MITEEEERRISATTAISASATAFRVCRPANALLPLRRSHAPQLPSRANLCRRCPFSTIPVPVPPPPRMAGGEVYFNEEAIDLAYDLHRIDLGRLYTTYFAGDGGLVVKADKEAWGCWLKHLPEVVIIGCPARDNLWEVRGFHSCLISRIIIGLPCGSVFAFWTEGPLSVHLLSLPTFLSLVLDFLPDKIFFLYDTLDFSIELTKLMAQEADMTINMEGFMAKMEGQKRRIRKARLATRGLLWWQGQGQWWWWQRWGGWWQGRWRRRWREWCQGRWQGRAQRRQWRLQLWWVAVAVEVAVVVVVMGVGGSSGIGEGEGMQWVEMKTIAASAMAGGHTTIN
jgi:hypothetical protein